MNCKLNTTGRHSLNLLTLLLGATNLLAVNAFGQGKSAMSTDELCQRLRIEEKIIVLDNDGKRIIDEITNERRSAKGFNASDGKQSRPKEADADVVCSTENRTGNSSNSFEGKVFIKHVWSVHRDGRISVSYEQGTGFEGQGREAKVIGSTGIRNEVIENFNPVSWVSPYHKKQRLVLRLIPTLAPADAQRELGKFPILISNGIIFDGSGRLWAANLTAEGEFLGITTPMGTLKLSLQSFEGGTKIGRMAGKEIRFRNKDGVTVLIKSDEPLLPGALVSDVFVDVDAGLKSRGIGSIHVSSGSSAEETFSHLEGGSR